MVTMLSNKEYQEYVFMRQNSLAAPLAEAGPFDDGIIYLQSNHCHLLCCSSTYHL